MHILEEIFRWHLEAFASDLFKYSNRKVTSALEKRIMQLQ